MCGSALWSLGSIVISCTHREASAISTNLQVNDYKVINPYFHKLFLYTSSNSYSLFSFILGGLKGSYNSLTTSFSSNRFWSWANYSTKYYVK
jgi:hypothetical protein